MCEGKGKIHNEEREEVDKSIDSRLKKLMEFDLNFDDTSNIIKDYFEDKKPDKIVEEINNIKESENSGYNCNKNNIVLNLKEYISTEESMASSNIVILSNVFSLIFIEIILIYAHITKGEDQVNSIILVLAPIIASIISWGENKRISKADFTKFKKINYVIDKIECNK